jgi:hypothetical protein
MGRLYVNFPDNFVSFDNKSILDDAQPSGIPPVGIAIALKNMEVTA